MTKSYQAVLLSGLTLLMLACSGGGEAVRERPAHTPPAVKISKARQVLLDEARTWLGVPYAFGGSSRNGVDCSGFVFSVYGKFGVRLPRTSRDMFGEGRAVNRGSMLPGDLVFFANTAGKGITHVGIFLGGANFIHASTRAGVITSSLDEAYYRKHYAGARKIIR
jgi:cell wall-associated NlpC family hydrolase